MTQTKNIACPDCTATFIDKLEYREHLFWCTI